MRIRWDMCASTAALGPALGQLQFPPSHFKGLSLGGSPSQQLASSSGGWSLLAPGTGRQAEYSASLGAAFEGIKTYIHTHYYYNKRQRATITTQLGGLPERSLLHTHTHIPGDRDLSLASAACSAGPHLWNAVNNPALAQYLVVRLHCDLRCLWFGQFSVTGAAKLQGRI